MSSKFYDLTIRTYLAIEDLKHKMERGDADSSGSTLRTVGIVALVLIVVAVIGAAVISQSDAVATKITGATFNFK